VRVAICIVQAMDLDSAARLAKTAAWFVADVVRFRRRVVSDNLRHAFPEYSEEQRREMAHRMWEHLLLLAIEVAHAPRRIHETNWRDFVELDGVDEVIRLLVSDRPTVVVTAHFGNFEVGGYLLGLLGYPTYTVARSLDNRFLNAFVNRFREATGQYIIAKNGEFENILAVMAGGGTMSFLADQHAGPKGCWVDFFGRQASAHKAIALLSLQHDAPVAVCAVRRLDRPLRFVMELIGIADPRDAGSGADSMQILTQWYTRRLETMIRRAPEQYWWVHRRWKEPPPKRAKPTRHAA
jgi:KDO2-lipid IV(A) lauroyltransferase